MVGWKYCWDVSIQNDGLKRVWILTHTNGCQSYDFLVIKKQVVNFIVSV